MTTPPSTPSALAIAAEAMQLPAPPVRLGQGRWECPSEAGARLPAGSRCTAVLDTAWAYDQATEALLEQTSADFVRRLDVDGYHPEMFHQAAAVAHAIERLDAQVAHAQALREEVSRKISELHDRESREANATRHQLDAQMKLIRETLDKQVKRYEQTYTQCSRVTLHREAELTRARNAAADRATIAEVAVTLDAIRSIASTASEIVRTSQRRPPVGGTPDSD